MKRLITAQRAIELAFSEGEFLPSESISTATILAVEQQRIKPIVGAELYQKLISGEYASLCEEFVHPPLALAIKLKVLPQLRVRIGPYGISEPSGEGFNPASDRAIYTSRRTLKAQIRSLLRRLSEELERLHSLKELPEYNPKENILNRCRTYGDIVQNV